MQLHPSEDAAPSESGIYYLVPNKYGPGKSLVRRPRPPPTSPPLDDDFDAATTTRGARTVAEWETQRTTRGPGSPLKDHFDVDTYAGAPPPPPKQPQPQRVREQYGGGEASGSGHGHGSYAKGTQATKHDGSETYGEYGQYMHELERKFGRSPDLDLTLSPTRSKKEVERATTVQNQKPVDPRISRIGKPSRLGSVGRVGGGGGDVVLGEGTGPRAGQAYEIVQRRVVEDGPERTVTISTWRQQVAEEAATRPGVDVYYLDTRDYIEHDYEGRGGVGETSDVDSLALYRRRRAVSTLSGRDTGTIGSIADELENSRDSTEQRRTTQRKSSGQTSQSLSSETKHDRSGSSSRSWSHAPARQATPIPDQDARLHGTHSPLPKATNVSRSSPYGAPISPPRSSTPIRRGPESPDRTQTQTPARGSTPNRTTTPMHAPDTSSFHPTQSGSTISTIKSASTIAFENVLATCDPSLLHLSPVLAKLGIMNEGHLRAMARLSEETRDREVKEEALRQGVTVMEWAILLDRLQVL
ncbi:hypothetical protein Hypma_016488 [Hypsizygus marmoreus]|uniref:Uncharacterized protein n=1 Tax=Hypsizygus marmoreus TaxID=39966 RepID=A0A369J5B6_HYPMA|nr:hypothetical protein Hypma_016488 [Hypsizygus marmoreus]